MYQFFTSDLFGIPVDTANMIANGVTALVVLFLLYLIYRMFTRPRMAGGRRSKNARLAITDAASIDDRRRIVLVRRDDVEHLIMIGGANDVVIESDINKSRSNRPAAPLTQSSLAAPVANHSPPAPPRPAAPVPPRNAPAPIVARASNAKNPTPPAAASPPASAKQPSGSANPSASVRPQAPNNPKPTPGQSNTAPTIAQVSNKPADAAPKSKTSVGDNMDTLLTEITTKK